VRRCSTASQLSTTKLSLSTQGLINFRRELPFLISSILGLTSLLEIPSTPTSLSPEVFEASSNSLFCSFSINPPELHLYFSLKRSILSLRSFHSFSINPPGHHVHIPLM
jgi:hypothetical protein